jgi:hypothetical protein
MLYQRHNDSIRLEVKTLPSYFDFLMPQAKKGVRVLNDIINPGYQKEIRLLLHNSSLKKKRVCLEYRRSLKVSLCCAMTVTKVNEKLQHLKLGRTTNSPDSWE